MCCIIKYQDIDTSALIEEYFKSDLSPTEFISRHCNCNCQIIIGENLNYIYCNTKTNSFYKLQKQTPYIFTSTESKVY